MLIVRYNKICKAYKDLGRRSAESDHGAVQDSADVQHGAVTSETDQEEAQTVRYGDEHERLLPAQVSEARSGYEAAAERRQWWNTTCFVYQDIDM